MPLNLDAAEARTLGSLIEKAFTTPEQYPLSFNALLNACNQKTSREPVMELSVDALGKGLAQLAEKGLARERLGSRVPKYAHYAEHLGAGDSPEILGILCLLLLRGPQTAAELRVRTERIAQFPSTEAVESALQKLLEHPNGPFVARLPRGRFQQLFSGEAPAAFTPAPASPDRLAELEKRLSALELRCEALEKRLSP